MDAADFAEMLLRMYTRWAGVAQLPRQVSSTPPTPRRRESGSRSPSRSTPCRLLDPGASGGTHRLVRISPSDNQGRRQTSFAAVEVTLPIESTDHIDIPETDIRS